MVSWNSSMNWYQRTSHFFRHLKTFSKTTNKTPTLPSFWANCPIIPKHLNFSAFWVWIPLQSLQCFRWSPWNLPIFPPTPDASISPGNTGVIGETKKIQEISLNLSGCGTLREDLHFVCVYRGEIVNYLHPKNIYRKSVETTNASFGTVLGSIIKHYFSGRIPVINYHLREFPRWFGLKPRFFSSQRRKLAELAPFNASLPMSSFNFSHSWLVGGPPKRGIFWVIWCLS